MALGKKYGVPGQIRDNWQVTTVWVQGGEDGEDLLTIKCFHCSQHEKVTLAQWDQIPECEGCKRIDDHNKQCRDEKEYETFLLLQGRAK